MPPSRASRWIATAVACGVVFTIWNYNRFAHPFFTSPEQHGEKSDATTLPSSALEGIDWSRFAYIQYVTNSEYLCNSVMIFQTLNRLGSLADRVMMYPEHMLDPSATEGDTEDAKLIIKARDEYAVKLMPIKVQNRMVNDPTWASSYTKLLAFNATQYDRVLALDSDSLIYRLMDELFLLPPCPVAMPRAYWLYPDKKILSSQLILLQPSTVEFARVWEKMQVAEANDYDMEIMNDLYGESAMIIPHRGYDLLTAEFRLDTHENYLGSDQEVWNAVDVFNEVKFVHFSDWPIPKPWIQTPKSLLAKEQPKCRGEGDTSDCSDRDIWNGIYAEFRSLRSKVCNKRV